VGGVDRRLDVGVLNGQRFTVMAGVGFDAAMMHLADDSLKDHLGRLAYVWTGTRATRMKSRNMRIKVDGKQWFSGDASGVLLGQFGVLSGGIIVCPVSSPDDGLLELGVVTAENASQWTRVFSRMVLGHADSSPLTDTTQGRNVDIKLSRPTRYELDGGARKGKKRLRARMEPGAIVVRVPAPDQ
jgi:diacylglycerol kinase family enzyme